MSWIKLISSIPAWEASTFYSEQFLNHFDNFSRMKFYIFYFIYMMPKNSADSDVTFREYSSSSNEYDSSFSSEDYELFADCKSKLLTKHWKYIICLGDRVGKAYRGLASMTRKHKLCRDWNELATWRLQYPHAGLNGAYCRFVFYSLKSILDK